ncbi:MAG: twin-arginine translocase TatA/TatE family subunit [Proteobacteria bacterium]|nr:twin-arginine translocase TatA/TatE family subunit [Pseudomonadota bacterium]MBU1716856.1 twin-arginine translocase TatA/TatE family subunit [Pseudomonadota bacterium]
MFGIGLPELILIMAVALIVVGPEKLPELAKSLAKQFVELKKTANALKQSLQEDPPGKPWEEGNPVEYTTPVALPLSSDENEGLSRSDIVSPVSSADLKDKVGTVELDDGADGQSQANDSIEEKAGD